MKNNKCVALVKEKLQSEKLRKLIEQQHDEDKWGSSKSELTKLIESNRLNEFDHQVARVFLARDYSLKCRYDKCFEIIECHQDISSRLTSSKRHHLALKGYMYHQFAVALGYMGRKEDPLYQLFYNEALKIYGALELEHSRIEFLTQTIDLDYYYQPHLDVDGICKEYLKISDKHLEENNIYFRLGLINLLGYLKSNNEKFINDAVDYFDKQTSILDKTHYFHYLSTCGLVIAKSLIKEDLPELPDAPEGAIGKAERFPLTTFILLKAFQLKDETSRAKRVYLNIERKLKSIISYFEDAKYKKFILQSYSLVINEWMLSTYENEKLTLQDKFFYMIHINEIIQNRLLSEKLSAFLTNKDGLIDSKSIVSNINNNHPSTGLIYVTARINKLKNQKQFFILFAEDISDVKTYSISTILSEDVQMVQNEFIQNFIINPGSSKEEQDHVLDHYGKLFFKDIDFSNSMKVFAVPNNFCLTLPLHMARKDNKYLYETIDNIYYVPNLHSISKTKNNTKEEKEDRLVIFHTTQDEGGISEAQAIKRLGVNKPVKLVGDPDEKAVLEKSLGVTAIHTIAHGKEGNIIFNGSTINGFDYCKLLPSNLNSISFSVCESGKFSQENLLYPIEHISWIHTLLEKNTRRVFFD